MQNKANNTPAAQLPVQFAWKETAQVSLKFFVDLGNSNWQNSDSSGQFRSFSGAFLDQFTLESDTGHILQYNVNSDIK